MDSTQDRKRPFKNEEERTKSKLTDLILKVREKRVHGEVALFHNYYYQGALIGVGSLILLIIYFYGKVHDERNVNLKNKSQANF